MARESAGLLMYRRANDDVEFFLVHPGGPFFAKKDAGAWTIPKGEPNPGEELQATAIREFREETGIAPQEPYIPLGFVKQKGGKTVHAWAFEGTWEETDGITCNTFELPWPPRSGKTQTFPEVDKAAFFTLPEAQTKINPAQQPLFERLVKELGA